MKNQKIFTFLAIILGGLVLIGMGGCGSFIQPSSPTEIPPDASFSHIAAAPENLQFIDFHFTPIDPSDTRLKKAISQDQAVLAALKFDSAGKIATRVTTQVGFSDGVLVHDLPNDRLVWLVTFYGLEMSSSGPPGSVHRVARELTVAVDAYQGNGIVSMTLGIVTPQPGMAPTSSDPPSR